MRDQRIRDLVLAGNMLASQLAAAGRELARYNFDVQTDAELIQHWAQCAARLGTHLNHCGSDRPGRVLRMEQI